MTGVQTCALPISKGYNMGIDFTGGTTIDINLHKYVENNELLDIIKAYDTTASIDYLGESKDKIQIKTTEKMEESKRLEVFSKIQGKIWLERYRFATIRLHRTVNR